MSTSSSRRKFIGPSLLLPLIAAAPSVFAKPKGSVLVAYFSRSGNTRVIAGQIHRARNVPLFEIEPANAYPEDYLPQVAA